MATMSPELIFAFVFLRTARPHGALDAGAALQRLQARFTMAGSDNLRMPTEAIFAVGTRRVILSFTKLMTNKFQPGASHFLLFDRHDLAHAMGRIDHQFSGLEALTLGGGLLINSHSGGRSFTGRFRPAGCLSHGSPTASMPRSL